MVKISKDKALIEEVITRWVSAIYSSRDKLREVLINKLYNTKKPLRIYFGVDPTGPNLHLGHLTNLLLLKRLQKLGHKVTLLIGDFTAMIGDPTDKMATRQPLTKRQVKENTKTFKKQASRIISFSGENPAEIGFNSGWYEKMNLDEFMWILRFFSVKNMLNRDMFIGRRRGRNEDEWLDSINLRELIYPCFQGYDGVKLDVDIEVGGNDQIFNMSIGRALRDAYSKYSKEAEERPISLTSEGEKFFIATTLLVDPKTGRKLMNKSEGGTINLSDKPEDVFGKVMALNDEAMFQVARLSSEMDLNDIEELKENLGKRGMNPRDAKLRIAQEVVKTIFGAKVAEKSRENFDRIFSKREMPEDLPILSARGGSYSGGKGKKVSAADLVYQSGVVKSKSEAWRLIEQGGFSVDGKTKKDPRGILNLRGGEVLKIGKKSFFKID